MIIDLNEALEAQDLERSITILNPDQGVQFTSDVLTRILNDAEIRISMGGKGRALDHVLVERLWRTVKYEEIYLKAHATVPSLYRGLYDYFGFYHYERPHQGLDYQTPAAVYHAVAR